MANDLILSMEWPAIASITYFSLNVLLLFALSIHIYKTQENMDITTLFWTIWYKQPIYAAVLVHIYDTATDIGVVFEWWLLANDGIEYNTINMRLFVWCSISNIKCVCCLFSK